MKINFTAILIFVFALSCSTIHGQSQDCFTSTKLCEKGTFHYLDMKGIGSVDESKEFLLCSKDFKEKNSYWLRWSILKEGNLTFVLDPINADDDLDFVLYKLRSDCDDLEELRCMSSGRTIGNGTRSGQPCEGKTGLSFESVDEFELSGCKFNDDNYLKFLQAEEGEEYILFVNNFTSPKGFSISLEGTAEFRKYDECFNLESDDHVNILEVFPNPALDEISVIYNKAYSNPIDIQILDIQGQIVWSKQSMSTPLEQRENIDVQDLLPGTYLVRINQGEFSSTRRFIKQ